MDVFLSWSGERSKRVAQALKDWLPIVFDNVNPWLSDRDIQAGDRWAIEISRHLEDIDFGIVCLTRENLDAPWILFEAGALSKALDDSYVCPYLLDVEVKEITGPLSQFQAKRTEKTSTLELLYSINNAASQPLREPQLSQRFEGLWPQLESVLEEIPGDLEEGRPPTRPTDEILEELVETVRTADRRISDLHTRLELFEIPTVERRPSPRSTASSTWRQVFSKLKREKNALTAAVYGEADAVLEGDRLFFFYPEEQSFYVGMANDPKHVEVLLDALETVLGWRPQELTASVRGEL